MRYFWKCVQRGWALRHWDNWYCVDHALTHGATPLVANGAIAAVAMIATVTHPRILALRPDTYLPISCWLLDTRITTTRIIEQEQVRSMYAARVIFASCSTES